MDIITDDQLRQKEKYQEFYDFFRQRTEKYSGGIKIFDAAERFYRKYFGLLYSCDHNSIRCMNINYKKLNVHLNGKRLDNIILGLVNKHSVNFLPAATIRIKHTFQRIMLINERGEFYLDDGTFLGSDYESIISDILSGKTEIAPIQNSAIFTSLERHGYNADRIIDTASLEEAFTGRGHKFFPAAKKFFEVIPAGKYIRWVNCYPGDCCCIGCFPDRRIKDNYEFRNKTGEYLLNIATTADQDYYISESGKYYAEIFASKHKLFYVTDDMYLFIQCMLIN